jgi:LytTr DNA-binding domain
MHNSPSILVFHRLWGDGKAFVISGGMSGELKVTSGKTNLIEIRSKKRRLLEVTAWVAFYFVNALVNATSGIIENIRRGGPFEPWEPFVWEFSSCIFILILVPAVLAVDRRYPITADSWAQRVALHLPCSVIFSILHVGAMVGLRKMIYTLVGSSYEFGHLWLELLYEYRKDLMSYFTLLVVIYAYREILRLRYGEVQMARSAIVTAPQIVDGTTRVTEPELDSRMLVSKGGTYSFIDITDIDWIDAAGNYVELHVGEHTYMLRGTMKHFTDTLAPHGFVRIHRSTIVNRARIERVVPIDNGDQTLVLIDGQHFRASRRYRSQLQQGELQQGADAGNRICEYETEDKNEL